MRTSRTTQLLETVQQLEAQRHLREEQEEFPRLLLQFVLGAEQYALNVEEVTSVEDPPRIVQVPGTPSFILGVVNLQSEIVTVVGLSEFLGVSVTSTGRKPRLIVVTHQDDTVAFLVDEVIDVIEISPSSIEPPLATLEQLQAGCLEGEIRINDKLVGILDLESVMTSPEMQSSRGD